MSVSQTTFSEYSMILLSLLEPIWTEVLFLVFFTLSFALLRFGSRGARANAKAKKRLRNNAKDVSKETVSATAVIPAEPVAAESRARAGFKVTKLDLPNFMLRMREYAKCNDVSAALTLFQQLQESHGRLPVIAYNTLLDLLVSAKALRQAKDVFRQMDSKIVDEVTYNIMIKGYAAAEDSENAWKLIQEMEQVGIKTTTTAYNCLLNMDSVSSDESKAWRIIKVMEGRAIPPDSYTLTTLLKTLRHSASPSDVIDRIFKMVDASGINVCEDEVLFITGLEACVKHNKLDRVRKIVSQCEASPSAKCMGAMHAHASLIKAYGVLRRVDMCRDVWARVTSHWESPPTNIAIACMLDALVCNNRANEAVSLFHNVTRKYSIPGNAIMYSTLIKGFNQIDDADSAMRLFGEMQEHKVPASTAVYNSIINAQARKGDVEQVLSLMAMMHSDGLEADGTTYATVLKCYCVQGKLADATKLFYDIAKLKDCSSFTSAYNTVVDGCIQHNRLDLAGPLVADMQRFKIRPSNFTLGTHIKYYDHAGELHRAMEIAEEWPTKYGIKPNHAIKTCLIRACVRHNETEIAFRQYKQLVEERPVLDKKAYRSLAISCIQGNFWNEAIALVEIAFGLAPSGEYSHARGNVQIANGQELAIEVAEGVLRNLAASGVEKDSSSQKERAQVLLQKLNAAGVRLSFIRGLTKPSRKKGSSDEDGV